MLNESTMKNKEIEDLNQFLKKNFDSIQSEFPESGEDYKRTFNYFIGEKLEGVSPERLRVCDRTKDQHLDFYIAGEDAFSAYQCKLGEFETFDAIPSYSDGVINELEDIFTFITDSAGTATGNSCSQKARNEFRNKRTAFNRLNPNGVNEEGRKFRLEINLVIYGKLTVQAVERLEELRRRVEQEELDLEFKVFDFDFLRNELALESFSKKDRPSKIKLEYFKDVFGHTNNWGFALVHAKFFKELYEKYGMALFDLNVRYYLKRSAVNKQIRKTLNESASRKRFHLLNNGITISCTSWETPRKAASKNQSERAYFVLHHPQIINGCQTVVSIAHAASQYDNEYKNREFEEECFVPVRIVVSPDPVVLDLIVTASNNQNKMTPRNLRSNSTVQRLLQRRFELRDCPWFYERKDGEFKSLVESDAKNRNFKPRNFLFKAGSYRTISNEDVAKSWLSFIGFSKDASEKIKAFDFDDDATSPDDSSRYEWLFEKTPTGGHWNLIPIGPQLKLVEENFDSQPPSPDQYLLSYFIYEFVKAYVPAPRVNRTESMKKLIESKKIAQNSSAEDINKALMEDDGYVLNQILANMKEVIVELYASVLIKRYGSITEEVAADLLRLPCLAELDSAPDFKSYVRELSIKSPQEKMDNLLFTCFEFIKDAVNRWKSINSRDYFASQRRIRFLHSAAQVSRFKVFLEESNKETIQFPMSWKPPNIEFYKSLPDLK